MVLEVIATAYCLFGTTATGLTLGWRTPEAVVAVDPGVIPLHSKMYVPGYGYARAQDTGGSIKGNHIDVWFKSCSKATHWGVKRRLHINVWRR